MRGNAVKHNNLYANIEKLLLHELFFFFFKRCMDYALNNNEASDISVVVTNCP